MHIASRSFIVPRRLAAILAVVTSAMLLSGFSAGSSVFDCRTGADAPDKAVAMLLTEVKNGDKAAASKLLMPGGTISDSEWNALSEKLQSEKIEDLQLIVESETATGYGVTVLDSSGIELDGFSLSEGEIRKNCMTIGWGDYEFDESDASQSATPNL